MCKYGKIICYRHGKIIYSKGRIYMDKNKYMYTAMDGKIIDKLNALTDYTSFWNDVAKLTKNVNSDKNMRIWESFSEIRYEEITPVSAMDIWTINSAVDRIVDQEYSKNYNVAAMEKLRSSIIECIALICEYKKNNNLKKYDNNCSIAEKLIADIREEMKNIDIIGKYCVIS